MGEAMTGEDARAVDRKRLAAFLRLLGLAAAAFGVADLALALVVRAPALFGTSLATLAVAAVTPIALRWIARGREKAGVELVAVVLLANAVCCAPLVPYLIAILAIVPFIVFALVLAWLEGSQLKRVALACVATEVSLSITMVLVPQEPPPLWERGLGAVALFAGVLLVVKLLLQHGERLSRNLAALNDSHRRLRESEELYRRMIEAASEGLWRADAQGRTSFVNTRMESLLGRSREELLETSVFDHLAHTSVDTARALAAEHQRGVSRREELTLRRKDGSSVSVLVGAVPVQDAAGGYAGFLWLVTDTSELAELQARLSSAEHTASIGNLAAGVAHDFNNNLTLILGRAESLARTVAGDAQALKQVTQIITASQRAAELTSKLLALGRKQVLQPRVLSLNELIESLRELLRSLLGEPISLRLELDPALPNVDVDPAQLERVLVNLALNARDAMPQGGQLEIRSGRREVETPTPGLSRGRYVTLSMTDTGCGMGWATRSRLFEPFFTTKPVGEGTGLGLSTAYGIVKQSGGHIAVESEPGRGSRFTIYLPESDGARDDVAVAAPQRTELAATETVLLVEDDSELRELIGAELTAEGYQVLEATDGDDALRVCEANSGPLHLVITDVVMSGMGGPELTKRLRAERPALPILFMSGHPERWFAPMADLVTAQNFIQKPFSVDALLVKVRESLSRS